MTEAQAAEIIAVLQGIKSGVSWIFIALSLIAFTCIAIAIEMRERNR